MITKTKKILRYDFTDTEKLKFGNELAQCSNEQAELESIQDRMKSEFKAKESAIEAKRLALSNALLSGYTMRDIECDQIMNDPKPGKVRIVRTENEDFVEVRDMTALEIEKAAQTELPLGGDEPSEDSMKSSAPHLFAGAPVPRGEADCQRINREAVEAAEREQVRADLEKKCAEITQAEKLRVPVLPMDSLALAAAKLEAQFEETIPATAGEVKEMAHNLKNKGK